MFVVVCLTQSNRRVVAGAGGCYTMGATLSAIATRTDIIEKFVNYQ